MRMERHETMVMAAPLRMDRHETSPPSAGPVLLLSSRLQVEWCLPEMMLPVCFPSKWTKSFRCIIQIDVMSHLTPPVSLSRTNVFSMHFQICWQWLLSPTTNNYDYVNYVRNTLSNEYRSTALISGVQEVSEDMWLHILIGRLIQTRLLEKSFWDPNSDYCVQASWQEPFFRQK